MPTLENMMRRQQVLADFGEYALRSDDLQEVLTEACRLICRALDASHGKVIEIEEDTALVRAGVGWPDHVIGQVRLNLNERSSEAYAIKRGEPVLSQDVQKEERFDYPDFLKQAGIVALLNVPIFLPGGRPYGLLQVDRTEHHDMDEQDVAFLRTYAAILGPVIDRLHAKHDLRLALLRNEQLMAELQHRIKNNIGTIAGLVRLAAKDAGSAEAREELRKVSGRVEALSVLHERLYAAKGREEVELCDYLRKLLHGLLDMNDAQRRSVTCRVDGSEDIPVKPERAIPIGLIVNEFATNSLKHAFEGKGGEITVDVRRDGGVLHLTLRDDGRGLPEAVGSRKEGTGLGLIDVLARQIGAAAEWSVPGSGTVLRLDIPG